MSQFVVLKEKTMYLLFARCVVRLVQSLPKEGKFPYYFRLLFHYCSCEKKVVEWHRRELERLDVDFRIQQSLFDLCSAKEKAMKSGLRPRDPKYPVLSDFYHVPHKKVG